MESSFIPASRNLHIISNVSVTGGKLPPKFSNILGLMDHGSLDLEREMSPADRRLTKRFLLSWPARIKVVDGSGQSFEETGELSNLSSAGALVRVDRWVQVGREIEVFIRVPLRSETWMKYPATVIRTEIGPGKAALALSFSARRPCFLIS